MTEAAPQTDPFGPARTNLRDTVKWLIAALAALAAAVLGGSPLTSFGTLGPGWRLYLAIGTGSLGLAFVLVAIYNAFRLLIGKPFFLSDMEANDHLRAFIGNHAVELLPPECESFEDLLRMRNEARDVLRRTRQQPDAPKRTDAERFIAQSDPFVAKLLSLAHYEDLRQRLLAAGRTLFALATCAVVFLGAFAWAANPMGKGSEPTHTVSSSAH